jgi:hypothetical protein
MDFSDTPAHDLPNDIEAALRLDTPRVAGCFVISNSDSPSTLEGTPLDVHTLTDGRMVRCGGILRAAVGSGVQFISIYIGLRGSFADADVQSLVNVIVQLTRETAERLPLTPDALRFATDNEQIANKLRTRGDLHEDRSSWEEADDGISFIDDLVEMIEMLSEDQEALTEYMRHMGMLLGPELCSLIGLHSGLGPYELIDSLESVKHQFESAASRADAEISTFWNITDEQFAHMFERQLDDMHGPSISDETNAEAREILRDVFEIES